MLSHEPKKKNLYEASQEGCPSFFLKKCSTRCVSELLCARPFPSKGLDSEVVIGSELIESDGGGGYELRGKEWKGY